MRRRCRAAEALAGSALWLACLGDPASAWRREPTPPPPPPPSPLETVQRFFRAHWLRIDEPGDLGASRPALCSVYADAVLLQAAFIALGLAGGLVSFAWIRRRFIARVNAESASNPFAFISPRLSHFKHSFQTRLPGVTVVMPCKGVHAQSFNNKKSQVTSLYGGPLEFIFTVESEEDEAYTEVQRLIQEMRDFDIKLVVAGLSFHCSQKIHNQLAGIDLASRSSSYVIVLDDDIKLHPGTIRCWVEEMESDPAILVASGYSFDWVPEDAMTLPTQLVMMWRMVAMAAFARKRPSNLWGGAMMFRREELQRNVYSIIDAWRDGGYSEDFITIALCRKHRRAIAVPLAAIFPNKQAGAVPFCRYWNYLCRQVFVLSTYAFPYHKFLALEMQLGLVLQNLAAACATALLLVQLATLAVCVATAAAAAGAAAAAPGVSALEAAAAAADGAKGAISDLAPSCSRTAAYAAFLVATSTFLAFTFQASIRCLGDLCNTLSPLFPDAPAAVNAAASSVHAAQCEARRVNVGHISVLTLLLTHAIHNFMVVAAWVRVQANTSIVWAGVLFTIDRGRVVSMHRKDRAKHWYTVPREQTLAKAMQESARHAAARLNASLG